MRALGLSSITWRRNEREPASICGEIESRPLPMR
jgi:hypothetical protein